MGREWCACVCKHKRNNNAHAYDDAHAYDGASAYTSHYANANANANAIHAIDNYDFYVLDNFTKYMCYIGFIFGNFHKTILFFRMARQLKKWKSLKNINQVYAKIP